MSKRRTKIQKPCRRRRQERWTGSKWRLQSPRDRVYWWVGEGVPGSRKVYTGVVCKGSLGTVPLVLIRSPQTKGSSTHTEEVETFGLGTMLRTRDALGSSHMFWSLVRSLSHSFPFLLTYYSVVAASPRLLSRGPRTGTSGSPSRRDLVHIEWGIGPSGQKCGGVRCPKAVNEVNK